MYSLCYVAVMYNKRMLVGDGHQLQPICDNRVRTVDRARTVVQPMLEAVFHNFTLKY